MNTHRCPLCLCACSCLSGEFDCEHCNGSDDEDEVDEDGEWDDDAD